GVERDRVDISIARTVGLEFGRVAQFVERGLGLLEAGQGEPEGMMQPGVTRRHIDRRAKDRGAGAVPPELPVESGEVDRGGRRAARPAPPAWFRGGRGP